MAHNAGHTPLRCPSLAQSGARKILAKLRGSVVGCPGPPGHKRGEPGRSLFRRAVLNRHERLAIQAVLQNIDIVITAPSWAAQQGAGSEIRYSQGLFHKGLYGLGNLNTTESELNWKAKVSKLVHLRGKKIQLSGILAVSIKLDSPFSR